ncbi:MAG: hypothetical protein LBL51_05240 [Synergistaceae bacterium]|nr:hypothetical protein [Synergistaceae bacterium]
MKQLYEQMEFVLSGGALKFLSDFLGSRVGTALITSPVGEDLKIEEAVGEAGVEELILRGQAGKIAAAFPEPRPLTEKFELNQAQIPGKWPWALRLRGQHWVFYIFLEERADDALLEDLLPYAGTVALWQRHYLASSLENRLASISYMILATKNTLASIFEPMPLKYFAAFFVDVLRESLFPRSISIFRDDGTSLSFLEGDESPLPERKGLFAQTIISPTPVLMDSHSAPSEVVMPILAPAARLFCVTEWDSAPAKDTLNFMELLGNLAQRALSIEQLRLESGRKEDRITSDEFILASLVEALGALRRPSDREGCLRMVADVLLELSLAQEALLVVWEKDAYVPVAYGRSEERKPFEPLRSPAPSMARGGGEPFFDLRKTDITALLACPWQEMTHMRGVLPFWNDGRLLGFMAVSADAIDNSVKLSALQIIAQAVASELRNFLE